MSEQVRLVIWDLDETFWKGTIGEGGINAYVQAHHDIVIELAQRGILSSICSKNDAAQVLPYLEERNIADYFIFPSINWEPKGSRLAALVETVQLRPGTVMFIDDNPGNRAEAAAMVPGLQVEDETFIGRLLDDPRFVGKDDRELTRLAQYKLLETRKKDEIQAPGGNEAFLRGCDIRVRLEYDIARHIDRVVELINRTNQLNFTKRRLPENADEARAIIEAALGDPFIQCGLVQVADKYGDYGFVGFFMIENNGVDRDRGQLRQRLLHYCFSCRTLGMQVERWLYPRIRSPQVEVVGEVLTDLSDPSPIDWIRMVQAVDVAAATPVAAVAPEIRIHGGCEANSVAHYLTAYAEKVVVTGNFHAGTNFVRVNGSSLLLSACDRATPEFAREVAILDLPYSLMTNRFFDAPPDGALFVLGAQLDNPRSGRLRHRRRGWEIVLDPHGLEEFDWMGASEADLAERIASRDFSPEAEMSVQATTRHLRANYEQIAFDTERDLPACLERIFDRLSLGSRVILMTDHSRVRLERDRVVPATWTELYRRIVGEVAARHDFVSVASFEDHVRDDDEICMGGNHYNRMVYYRMAEAIVAAARAIPGKSSVRSPTEPALS